MATKIDPSGLTDEQVSLAERFGVTRAREAVELVAVSEWSDRGDAHHFIKAQFPDGSSESTELTDWQLASIQLGRTTRIRYAPRC